MVEKVKQARENGDTITSINSAVDILVGKSIDVNGKSKDAEEESKEKNREEESSSASQMQRSNPKKCI